MHLTLDPIPLSEIAVFSPEKTSGALASFVGFVRNHDEGRRVRELYYECYPAMAEKMMNEIICEIRQKWAVDEVRVLHRVGRLEIGEAAVAIGVSAAHRAEAFAACRYLIEEIKHRVPIWKKQIFEDGQSEWVSGCGHVEESVV